MWPQILQMSRDECRGLLRRLELESYSQVISVLRAQGGLSENKVKLLEELRGTFHISQERHRAEARRVANDEMLATIAENISGPNTCQEWSREGRRPYPMLPRIVPQTALSIIANKIAAATANENAKLPLSDGNSNAAEQNAREEVTANSSETFNNERKCWNIVSSDPFKMPNIPETSKKPLKRNMAENANSNKKRSPNDSLAMKQQKIPQQDQIQNDADAGAALNSNADIQKLYHDYSKTQPDEDAEVQQPAPKPKRRYTRKTVGAQPKRQTTARGKRAVQPRKPRATKASLLNQTLVHADMPDQSMEMPPDLVGEGTELANAATSKKNISKNASNPNVKSQKVSNKNASATVTQYGVKTDKHLISTPVQKYIVEDRQSPAVAAMQSTSTSPQIMTLAQLSATGSQLRAMSTSLFPPATKQLPKTPEYTTEELFNIIDGTVPANNTPVKPVAHLSGTPTHSPPAVIQLNNTNAKNSNMSTINSVGEPAFLQSTSSQGKFVTTKLFPIVLSSNSARKIETLNNGATIVPGSSSVGAVTGNGGVFKAIAPALLAAASSAAAAKPSTAAAASGHKIFHGVASTGTMGPTKKVPTAFNASVSHPTASAPKILSNIKFSPAPSASSTGTAPSTQTFIKAPGSSGIRASVKICQSSNGKMFIQSANADALKAAKIRTNLQQKLLSSRFAPAASEATASASAGQPPRIAIQKVQIIHSPMTSPSSYGASMQPQQQKSPSLAFGNKANMIFMPTTCGTRGAAGSPVSKLGAAANICDKNSGHQQADVSKQNVFVIGAVAQQQQQQDGMKARASDGSNQMITEDTPVDILNTPIIVDSNNPPAKKPRFDTDALANAGNNSADRIAVLSNDILNSGSFANTGPPSSAMVLGVTDWEMELDQATAVAAAMKASRKHISDSVSVPKLKKSDYQGEQQPDDATIIDVDDDFDDVIVEDTFYDESTVQHEEPINYVMVSSANNQTHQEEQSPLQTIDEHDMQMEPLNNNESEANYYSNENIATAPNSLERPEENYIETIATEMDENTAIEYIEEDNRNDNCYEEKNIFEAPIDIRNKSANVTMENVLIENNNTVNDDEYTFNNCGIRTTCKKTILDFEQPEYDVDDPEFAENNSFKGN